MPCSTEQDICNFFISKSKDAENVNISEAKAWLLTGRSMIPKNFQIQLHSFLLEKRHKNVEGCARCFESLFKKFPMEIIEEVNEMANAVQAVTLATQKATEEDVFMCKVFNALLPVEMRMEVLMHWSEHTPIILEKCQSVLLMVKLFPNIVNQHGGNMLYTLSGCDTEVDVYSPFRKHLVTELVPAVLRLCKNLHPSPALINLLNQCIEYYVLVDENREEDNESAKSIDDYSRWEKLFSVVDQIGSLLGWSIAPFFRDASHSSGIDSVETLLQSLLVAVQHRNHYSPIELAYIAVVIFLRCITSYSEKLFVNPGSKKFGDKSRLTLVEVFLPSSQRHSVPDPSLPVITTVSSCSSLSCDPSTLLQNFTTATKIWQLIQSVAGDRLEKEFFIILSSMKSLNFEKWNVFQEFEFDFKTYTGKHVAADSTRAHSSIKLASMFCALGNFKVAAEYAIKAVNEISSMPSTPVSATTPGPIVTSPTADSRLNPMSRTRSLSTSSTGASTVSKTVNFSFFNCPSYATDNHGNLIPQRRVHFISENKSEVLAYAANVLIQCFNSALDISVTQKDDRCIGHLMTLLQLEWYSPTADMLLTQILEIIRRKGSFRYYPYFADFIIEGDILEQFMALSSDQTQPLVLDIFSSGSGVTTGSRRMGTRGVERGAKTDFKANMKKQMLKNARENLESLLIKFLTLNQVDLLACLDV